MNNSLGSLARRSVIVLLLSLVLPPMIHPQSAPSDPGWRRVQEKARAAGSGDVGVIESLTQEIIQLHGLEGVSALVPELKDRLATAEMSYRAGQRLGVAEIQIVKVINAWAHRLKAPAFGRTSTYEVRRLRVALLSTVPSLLLRTQGDRELPSSLDVRMSPLEAFHVLVTLAYQKLYNPDYQLTAEERISRWAEIHPLSSRAVRAAAVPSERSRELVGLLEQNLAGQSAIELQKLIQGSLALLDLR